VAGLAISLAYLFTPPPHQDGWKDFWFYNWLSHEDIVQAIGKQKNVPLTMYMLQPWTKSDMGGQLVRHQAFHTDMNQVLGIQGQDLSILDTEDTQAVKDWVWSHYAEHQQAHKALRL
jgi:hypothetical protein